MRALQTCTIIGFLLLASFAMAQSVFNGTWRPDPDIYKPTHKPDTVELANGIYDCQTCTPAYKINADGTDQPISGNPYYDTLSIAIVDNRRITKIAKKSGKTVAESHISISADNMTETEVQTVYLMAPRPIELTTRSSRLSPIAQGAHLISGSWRRVDTTISNHAEDTIFKVTGDTLEMTDRMDRSFTAKLDGTEAPYKGSDEYTSVSVKLIDSNTIEEFDKKDGKVVKISHWNIGTDGKTMHVRFDDTHGYIQEQTGHKVE